VELSIKSSTAGSSIMGLSHTQAGKLASGSPLLGFQGGHPGGLLLAPPRGSGAGPQAPSPSWRTCLAVEARLPTLKRAWWLAS